MKTLKKTGRKTSLRDAELSIYQSGKATITREYYVLRNDVFDFLGIYNATAGQHSNFVDLHLGNEK